MGHDIQLQELRRELEEVNNSLHALAKKNEIERIIELIKVKRGWTTPAELAFAKQITTNIHNQLGLLDKELAAFEAAAKLVKVQVEVN